MTQSRECGWKDRARTACPVLIDNLTSDEVDAIWGEISRINWSRRDEDEQMVKQEPVPVKRTSRPRRAPRSR